VAEIDCETIEIFKQGLACGIGFAGAQVKSLIGDISMLGC